LHVNFSRVRFAATRKKFRFFGQQQKPVHSRFYCFQVYALCPLDQGFFSTCISVTVPLVFGYRVAHRVLESWS
jgi:hypothetical protein